MNRCEYSNFSPLDPFNIYAIAAVLLVDYVYSQRKPMGVSLVQFNSVNSRERRWSFFFKTSFAYYELSSVVKKPAFLTAAPALCYVCKLLPI